MGLRAGLDGCPDRDSNPDRPARSKSLYRLSYPAPNVYSININLMYIIRALGNCLFRPIAHTVVNNSLLSRDVPRTCFEKLRPSSGRTQLQRSAFMILSSYLFVCPSAWNNSTTTVQIFMKFDIRVFFENLSRRLKLQ